MPSWPISVVLWEWETEREEQPLAAGNWPGIITADLMSPGAAGLALKARLRCSSFEHKQFHGTPTLDKTLCDHSGSRQKEDISQKTKP